MRKLMLGLMVFAACGDGTANREQVAPDNSHDSLVRVDSEPAGSHCAAGGVAIQSGTDTNGDGTLEDGEITSTQYVCNGTTAVRCAETDTTHSGSITISSLADFDQLTGVSCIDGDLLIASTDVVAMPPLDPKTVTGSVVIAANTNLTSLDGFDLQQVGGTILVQGNPALTDLTGLQSLTKFGSLQIVNDDALTDLAGLSTFTKLAGLVVASNAHLTSLHGLEAVTQCDGLTIKSNKALTSVAALGALQKGAAYELSGNSQLTDITLPALQKLDQRLIINTNVALTSVSLPQLESVAGLLQFDADAQLVTISAPNLLLTGSLYLQDVIGLETVSMHKLTFATESILMLNAPQLASPDFASLQNIGTDLAASSTALQIFDGMPALESVGGNMTVQNNDALTSFSGLSSFGHVGGNLLIQSNPALPHNVAEDFAATVTVSGQVTIN